MTLALVAIMAGFILLTLSADRLVVGASVLAKHVGVSSLMIGITIVAVGTSAPEIVVSIMASLAGNPSVAVGNALGSNIMNTGLVLGLTALIRPLAVERTLVTQEFPILMAITLLAGLLLANGDLSPLDGTILIASLGFFLLWLFRKHKNGKNQLDPTDAAESSELIPEETHHMSIKAATFWVVLALIMLPVSSRILVWGAVEVAVFFNVSELVIGLTVIAIGTSLPELATSVMGAIKGEHDIALGNIIGSNIFNLAVVLGIPGLLHPITLDSEVMTRDYPVMLGLTTLLFFFAYTEYKKTGHRHALSQTEGFILLTGCIGYVIYLVLSL